MSVCNQSNTTVIGRSSGTMVNPCNNLPSSWLDCVWSDILSLSHESQKSIGVGGGPREYEGYKDRKFKLLRMLQVIKYNTHATSHFHLPLIQRWEPIYIRFVI